MTVAAHGPREATYTTDGSSNTYAVNFPFWELQVYLDGVEKTLGSDYTVTGGSGTTGSISFVAVQSAGKSVKIYGQTTAKQELDLTAAGTLEPENIEKQLDRLTLKVQELEDKLSKTVRVSRFVANLSTLHDPADHEGHVIGVDSNGNITFLTTVEAGISGAVIAAIQDLAYLDTVSTAYIDNDAVTYAKLQNVSATSRILGRISSGAGDVEELTATNVLTIIKGTVTGWTGQQYFAAATLTDAATIDWNLDTQQVATVTLGGNRTMAAPTNLKNGATYVLIVKQDATGSRTLNWSNSVFKFPGGTEPVMSTAANAVDVLTFVSDGTSLYGVIQKAFS